MSWPMFPSPMEGAGVVALEDGCLGVGAEHLLQRFDLSTRQESVPLDTQGITLRPGGRVPIELTPR